MAAGTMVVTPGSLERLPVLFFGGGAAGAVGVGLVHGAVPAGGEFAGVDYSAESSPLF